MESMSGAGFYSAQPCFKASSSSDAGTPVAGDHQAGTDS